ncbi:hypothetical protein BJ742DRAFT_775999 [Cladochytrium replicatum]|nr:hypothetical protein BJ742DRAFT_775999 [Cladochytrium replicatum]
MLRLADELTCLNGENSGLECTWSAEEASSKRHIAVLEWWKSRRLESDKRLARSTTPVKWAMLMFFISGSQWFGTSMDDGLGLNYTIADGFGN